MDIYRFVYTLNLMRHTHNIDKFKFFFYLNDKNYYHLLPIMICRKYVLYMCVNLKIMAITIWVIYTKTRSYIISYIIAICFGISNWRVVFSNLIQQWRFILRLRNAKFSQPKRYHYNKQSQHTHSVRCEIYTSNWKKKAYRIWLLWPYQLVWVLAAVLALICISILQKYKSYSNLCISSSSILENSSNISATLCALPDPIIHQQPSAAPL